MKHICQNMREDIKKKLSITGVLLITVNAGTLFFSAHLIF